MKPVLHSSVAAQFEQIAHRLPHAIELYGEEGVGLQTAALYLAGQAGADIEVVLPEKSDKVNKEDGTITIDVVRRLYRTTSGKAQKRRCIVIAAADTMSHAAQNAFLKLLEEPTNNTTFLLLVHHPDRLLPTVHSRLQRYHVRPVTQEQSLQLLDRLRIVDSARRQQLLFIGTGKPALLTKLALDEKCFEAEAEMLRKARTFIQGGAYEKLTICHELRSQRDAAVKLVNYAMTLLKAGIVARPEGAESSLRLLERLERAAGRLRANGNIRLVLGAAVLS